MRGFRLGKILGFEIQIDLSWFLIFFLILWTLAFNLFPANYPGLGGTTYLLMGITATLLFFASLLAHELSHSLVARAKGIPVEGITLFLFGGVSRTRMEAENPGDEFQIAGIGPLTSLVLSGLFALLSWLGQAAGWSVAVVGVTNYLAVINLALAIFNLLPGFPLDGGRLFRAIVWRWTGDLTKATRIASTGGRWLGYALIALGILQLFSLSVLNGLWLILIGWFLLNAAESSYQDVLMRDQLAGVLAVEVMTPDPETVEDHLTLQTFVDEYVLHRNHQAYPVIRDGHPIGIITLRQVKEVPRGEWTRRTVRSAMTPISADLEADPQQSVVQVLEKMERSGSRRVLVTRNQALAGIITASDIANWLQRRRFFGGGRATRQALDALAQR